MMEEDNGLIEQEGFQENDTQHLDSGEEEEHRDSDYTPSKRRQNSSDDRSENHKSEKISRHRKRRSGEDNSDYDDEYRHHHSSSKRHSEDRDSHHRRHHRHSSRKDRERSSRRSKRHDESYSSQEIEVHLEDGELEDGEIDDEEPGGHSGNDSHTSPKVTPEKMERQRSSSDKEASPKKYQREYSGQTEEGSGSDHGDYQEAEYSEEPFNGEEEGKQDDRERSKNHRSDQDSRKRRKERREKDKKRKTDDKKKKKKRHEYHDYDKVDEDFEDAWTPSSKKSGSNSHGSRRNRESSYNDDDYHQQGKYERGYSSPYDSPPGPYDSPSYDEDSEGEQYERKPKQTLMSMVEGEYIDASVVNEDVYKRRDKKKKPMHLKRKIDRQQSEQPMKKKPLLMTPMNERPMCKFFREGKCSKGDDCPFNHDFRIQKKVDLCKFYLNGSCSKGDNCIFMHSEFPCKYFHTGAVCYSGDNCRFSHEPLTEETSEIVERFYGEVAHAEEEHNEDAPPRPSLLGSPPRQNPEAERIKKIPSLFDIKVYPPGQKPMGQSPKKPMHEGPGPGHPEGPGPRYPGPGPGHPGGPYQGGPGPHNMQPQHMQGPPPRPSGFYTDMNQPPQQMGPRPSAINPAVELVGALLRQAAPQVLRPQMGPRPPLLSMPQPYNNMNGPPPMGPGQGPRMGQGPPPGQGGQFEFGAPPPNAHFGPPGGNRHPTPEQIMSPNTVDMPPGNFEMSSMNEMKDQIPVSQQMEMVKQESVPDSSTAENAGDGRDQAGDFKENEKILANLGVDLETLENLPAKNRELYLRIQTNRLLADGQDENTSEPEDPSKKMEIKVKEEQDNKGLAEKPDDDDWYSSDEEEGGAPKTKLTDILKNLSQKPSVDNLPSDSTMASQSSSINIMQMINNIKSQTSTASPVTSTQSTLSNDAHSAFQKEAVKKEPPEPVYVNSSEGDIPYKLRPLVIEKQKTAPKNIDLYDSQFKNDPRIKKFISQLEALSLMNSSKPSGPSDSPNLETTEAVGQKIDPRTGQPVIKRKIDPRLDALNDANRPMDPRIQRSISENNVRPMDPRMRSQSNPTGMGVHNLPVKSLDPRFINRQDSKTMDPRLSRQISQDGNSVKMDPRVSKLSSKMDIGDPSNRPNDPRKGPPVSGAMSPDVMQSQQMGDPRLGSVSQQSLPRLGGPPQDPRSSTMPPQTPRALLTMPPQDPRLGGMPPQDPRMNLGAPRMGFKPNDPRMNQQQQLNDPLQRLQIPTDPRQLQRQVSGSVPPGPSDPRRQLQGDSFSRQVPNKDSDMVASHEQHMDINIGLQIEKSLAENLETVPNQMDNSNSLVPPGDTEAPKPKLDHRNDPRFKRKPASESVLAQKRYTGQRKGSMEYSSPLGLESDSKGDGYNSYNRPPTTEGAAVRNNVQVDPRARQKLDPRTSIKLETESMSSVSGRGTPPLSLEPENDKPELAPFVPPMLEPKMKDLFQSLDPTASPFC